jgi:hypothetical protein
MTPWLESAGMTKSRIFLIGTGLFWLLGSYPAKMSPDSSAVWKWIKRGEWNDWHTVSYELFVYITSLGGRFIFLTAVVQSSLVIYSIWSVIRTLRPNLSRAQTDALTGLIFLIPFIGGVAVSIWKDVVFSALLVIGTTRLVTPLKSRKNHLLTIFVLTSAALFRHDGWPTLLLAGLLAFALVFFFSAPSRNAIRSIGVILILSAILSAFISPALVKVMGAVESPKWFATSAFLADLQYVNAQAPMNLSDGDKKILDEISGESSRNGSLNCASVNEVVFADDFDTEAARKYWLKIGRMWLTYMRGPSADMMVRAHLCRSGVFLPPPFANSSESMYTLPSNSEQPDDPQLAHKDVIPGLHGLVTIWSQLWQFNDHLTAWPGLHALLIFILCFYLYRTPRHKGFLLPLVVLTLSRVLILTVFGLALDFRYAYSVIIFSFSLAGIFAYEKISEARISNRLMGQKLS